MHCCVLAFVLEKLVFSSAFTQCLFLQFTILEHTSGPFVQLVLQGLYRNDGEGWVYQIEEAKCCKPNTLPEKYQDCYNENIWGSFDHIGLSACKRKDYYVAGFYKSNCNTLGCIEELKCCRMIVGEF